MGCASSAALPFLTSRGNQAVKASADVNGKPSYELNMVNNKLTKENGVGNVKDINETYVSDKMKEVVDSTTVQGVIGGVVQTKDDIVSKVEGFGEAVSEKVTSVVDGVEDTIEATFGKLTNTAQSIEDSVTAEVKSIGDDIKSVVNLGEKEESEMKAEDIDELLDALPSESEVTSAAKAAAEEVLDKAEEEMKEEAEN